MSEEIIKEVAADVASLPKERTVPISELEKIGLLSIAQQRDQLSALLEKSFAIIAKDAKEEPAKVGYRLSEDGTEIILIDAQ
jgi:hypothetical protein